jgi:hypothetical protein
VVFGACVGSSGGCDGRCDSRSATALMQMRLRPHLHQQPVASPLPGSALNLWHVSFMPGGVTTGSRRAAAGIRTMRAVTRNPVFDSSWWSQVGRSTQVSAAHV